MIFKNIILIKATFNFILQTYIFKSTQNPHVMSPSYKHTISYHNIPYLRSEIQVVCLYAVSLKIKVNRPIMKLDGIKHYLCFVGSIFTIIQFLSELCAFLSIHAITHKTQIMFLPSSFIIGRFTLIFKLTAYNLNF